MTTTTPDPLAARLAVLLTDWQRRYRRSQRGWGAFVFPAVPDAEFVHLAAELAPLMRELVIEVLHAQKATQ
jgi:hypothetical protein